LDSDARWKEVFPEEALPELILDYSDGDHCIIPAESSLHSTENHARVAFALPIEKGVPRRVRLDPFSGPGNFSLREIQVQFEGDEVPKILDSEEWKVIRRSIGKRDWDAEENSSFVFLGSDPSLYLEFQAQVLSLCPAMIYFDYRYEFGPPVRRWFLREWKAIEKNFPELVDQVASLETELGHLKDELSREIERRRTIQSSRAYRWTRGLQRLWGKRK
jgi:ribosomal protein S13